MNDDTINLESKYEINISSITGMWVSLDSHLPPLSHDRMGQKVISLSDDYDSERVSRNSLDEIASSFDSFEALLSDDGEGGDHIDVAMPLSF